MYRKLEQLLREHRITTYRLSKDTGIPYTTIRNWKIGRAEPKSDKLLILAGYFGVSIEYFLKP